MLCDASLVLGETKLARYELKGTGLRRNGIKVGSEVAALLELERSISWNSFSWEYFTAFLPSVNKHSARYWYSIGIKRHAMATHNLQGFVEYLHQGIISAFMGIIGETISALLQVYFVSDYYARVSGAFGCLFGLILSVFYVIFHLFLSLVVFLDRLLVGIANGCLRQNNEYILNPGWQTNVYRHPIIEAEKDSFRTRGIAKARKQELHRALDQVIQARIVFESARPKYPRYHRHYLVVKGEDLISCVKSTEGRTRLGFNRLEIDTIIGLLNQLIAPPSIEQSRESLLRSMVRSSNFSNRSFIINASGQGLASHEMSMESNKVSELRSSGTTTVNTALLEQMLKRKEDECYVSFSMFLLCMQTVCASKLCHTSRRMDTSFGKTHGGHSDRSRALSDFSEYLN